jgi:hypothetical protein
MVDHREPPSITWARQRASCRICDPTCDDTDIRWSSGDPATARLARSARSPGDVCRKRALRHDRAPCRRDDRPVSGRCECIHRWSSLLLTRENRLGQQAGLPGVCGLYAWSACGELLGCERSKHREFVAVRVGHHHPAHATGPRPE